MNLKLIQLYKQSLAGRDTPMSRLLTGNLHDLARAIEKHEGYKGGNYSAKLKRWLYLLVLVKKSFYFFIGI